MANQGSTRMTTDQLRAMIAGGATREELPTKAGGGSVSSTVDSAQRAYLAAIQKAERTRKFKEAQQTTARIQSQQRTEDLKIQAAQRAQAELEKNARMIEIANNAKEIANYTAQTQNFSDTTKYKVHGNNNPVSNNNIIANDVWSDPNVTVTGQSRTSRPSSTSIAASENYNTASAMNDFMSANPSSDINIGSANPQVAISWKSTAPQFNSVKTSDLGGDIQHIETDSNTNVGYLPFQNQIPSNTNWSSPMPSMASTGVIILGGLAALLLLGRKK